MVSVIGVQIGQGRETTAIAVAEAERRAVGDKAENHFLVRHLGRLPSGTPYPAIVQRLTAVAAGVRAKAGARPRLCVDATGVMPVLDLLSEEGLEPVACHFNHGGRRNEVAWREISIGKGFLVTRMKVLLQACRLHLPRTPEAETLRSDLQDYQLRLEDGADDRPGAFRVGSQDDLITALGLAVQDDADRGPTFSVDLSLCG
jgi:hypothetical protein